MDIENKVSNKKKGKKTLKTVVGVGIVIAVGTVAYGIGIANYSKIDNFLRKKTESTVNRVLGKENADGLRKVSGEAAEKVGNYFVEKMSKLFDDLGIQYDR